MMLSSRSAQSLINATREVAGISEGYDRGVTLRRPISNLYYLLHRKPDQEVKDNG